VVLIWTVISQQDINLTAISKCRGPRSRKWALCAKDKKHAIEAIVARDRQEE
jgi:hypothetical protein